VKIQIEHESLKVSCGFEEFTRRLESALGRFDAAEMRGFKDDPHGAAERLRKSSGDDGLLLFDVLDHGSLAAVHGKARKAKQYVVGNPLIAARMTRHDIRAGLYAPLRLFVFEDDDGSTRVEFDRPSSLFGQFRSAAVDAVAQDLDSKLRDLIGRAGGDSHGI
jgi:uncharacterized protein (DUF302 family)